MPPTQPDDTEIDFEEPSAVSVEQPIDEGDLPLPARRTYRPSGSGTGLAAPGSSSNLSLSTPRGEARADMAFRQGQADEFAAQRAQAVATKRAEVETRKNDNTALEKTMRGTGQKFYTDPHGKIQPIIEADTGRPMFHPTLWEDGGTHPQTGEPTLVRRDQYGQKQYKAPPIVASPDLTDDQLYYKFADDDLRPAGKVEDLKAHPNFNVARLAKRTAAQRRSAMWKEAIAPMEAVSAEMTAQHEMGTQRVGDLQAQIDALTEEGGRIQDSTLTATQGGFLGIGGSPTPEATAAQGRKAQIDASLEKLSTEQAQLQDKLKPLGELGRKKRSAALDLAIFKAKAQHDSYTDLAEERRDILKMQGKPEEGDPTLRSILDAQATYGAAVQRAAKISEQDALQTARAPKATLDVDFGEPTRAPEVPAGDAPISGAQTAQRMMTGNVAQGASSPEAKQFLRGLQVFKKKFPAAFAANLEANNEPSLKIGHLDLPTRDIERTPENPITAADAIGAYNAAADFVSGLTSPNNGAIMAALGPLSWLSKAGGLVGVTAKKALAAVELKFAHDMSQGAAEAAGRLSVSAEHGGPGEAAGDLTSLALNATAAGGLAKGAGENVAAGRGEMKASREFEPPPEIRGLPLAPPLPHEPTRPLPLPALDAKKAAEAEAEFQKYKAVGKAPAPQPPTDVAPPPPPPITGASLPPEHAAAVDKIAAAAEKAATGTPEEKAAANAELEAMVGEQAPAAEAPAPTEPVAQNAPQAESVAENVVQPAPQESDPGWRPEYNEDTLSDQSRIARIHGTAEDNPASAIRKMSDEATERTVPVDSGPRDSTVSTSNDAQSAETPPEAIIGDFQKRDGKWYNTKRGNEVGKEASVTLEKTLTRRTARLAEQLTTTENALPIESPSTPTLRQAPENRETVGGGNPVDQGAAGAQGRGSERVAPVRGERSGGEGAGAQEGQALVPKEVTPPATKAEILGHLNDLLSLRALRADGSKEGILLDKKIVELEQALRNLQKSAPQEGAGAVRERVAQLSPTQRDKFHSIEFDTTPLQSDVPGVNFTVKKDRNKIWLTAEQPAANGSFKKTAVAYAHVDADGKMRVGGSSENAAHPNPELSKLVDAKLNSELWRISKGEKGAERPAAITEARKASRTLEDIRAEVKARRAKAIAEEAAKGAAATVSKIQKSAKSPQEVKEIVKGIPATIADLKQTNPELAERAMVGKASKEEIDDALESPETRTVRSAEHPKITKEWSAFSPESQSLGIPRAEMPQVKSEARGALVNFLKARDIPASAKMVKPTDLKPTQAEFSPAKVEAARKHEGTERPILVAADNQIVDGHHQWMAALDDPTTPMPVIKLGAPIDKVLAEMKDFPSAEAAKGGVSAEKAAEAAKPAAPRLTDRALDALKKEQARIIKKREGRVGGGPEELFDAGYYAALQIAEVAVRAGRATADVVKLAVDRFKAKHPGHSPADLAKVEADVRNAITRTAQEPVDKGDLSKVPQSLKDRKVPVDDIAYEVRSQDERMKEAEGIVKMDGDKAIDAISERRLPADTRVAIGGVLLAKKMEALRKATTPEETAAITKDIQRITEATRSGVSTESGQGVAMHQRIYQDIGVAAGMEYVKSATEKRGKELGGEEGKKAAKEAADIFNKDKDPATREAEIEKLKERYTTKPVRKMLDQLKRIEIAKKLNDLGVLTADDMVNVAGNALGMPGIEQAKLKHIAEMAERIKSAKNHAERSKAELELADTLSIYKGVNPLDLEASILTLNILSGPTTQAANIEGNALNMLAQLGTTAVVNPSKVGTLAKGFMDGIGLGITQAGSIMKTGRSTRDFQDKTGGGMSHLANIDYARDFPITAGKGGDILTARARAVDKISRFMKAADAVFYYPAREAYARLVTTKLLEGKFSGDELAKKVSQTLHITPEAFDKARKQATLEGYEGIDQARRVSDIIEDNRATSVVGKEAVKQSERFAAESTFTNEPVGLAGVIYRNLARTVKDADVGGVPVLKPWAMFLRTPANVFNATTNFTPAGATRAFFGMKGEGYRKGGTGEKQWRDFNKDERNRLYVQSIVGTTLMGGLVAQALQGRNVNVTASGPNDPSKRRQLQQAGWIPYSIKVGDKYVSYKDSPLLIPLAIVGHVADSVKYQKSKSDLLLESKIADAVAQAPQIIFQTSMLSSLSDLMSSLSGQGNAASTIGRTLGSIPANLAIPYNRLLQQVDQTFDSQTYKNNPVVGSVPFARRTGTPQTDVQGRPQTYTPASRFIGTDKHDPVDSVLQAKNIFIPELGKDQKLGNRQMTDEEHDKFRKMSGQRIRVRLQAIIPLLRGMNQENAQKKVNSITNEERDRVKPLIGVAAKR